MPIKRRIHNLCYLKAAKPVSARTLKSALIESHFGSLQANGECLLRAGAHTSADTTLQGLLFLCCQTEIPVINTFKVIIISPSRRRSSDLYGFGVSVVAEWKRETNQRFPLEDQQLISVKRSLEAYFLSL